MKMLTKVNPMPLQTSHVRALKSDSFDHLLYFTPAARPTFRGQCGYLTPTGLNVYGLPRSSTGWCHVISRMTTCTEDECHSLLLLDPFLWGSSE